jgi:hypothetical protein
MNHAETLLVAALRSGKYKQGRDRLKTNDRYCCLAVACEVYQENVGGLTVDTYHEYDYEFTRYNTQKHYLPEAVKVWLGWKTDDGRLDNDIRTLADRNDAGASFAELAEIIEGNHVIKA